MWIFLSVMAALFLIAICPLNVVLSYSGDLTLYLQVLFVKIAIIPQKINKPRKKRSPRAKKTVKKKPSPAKSAQKKAEKKSFVQRIAGEFQEVHLAKQGGGITSVLALVRGIAGVMLKYTGKTLRVRAHRIDICVGSDDAAKTAMLYGAISQALSYTTEFLRTHMHFKVRTIAVRADYTAEQTTADIKLTFSIRIYQVLSLMMRTAMQYVKSTSAKKTLADTSEQSPSEDGKTESAKQNTTENKTITQTDNIQADKNTTEV